VSKLAAGARQLPLQHITIRVPWHDSGWAGTVCSKPQDNTSCLILPRIGDGRRDAEEANCACQRLDQLKTSYLPPCIGERGSFMAPFDISRSMTHPYAEIFPETHGGFAPTTLVQPAHSAACVPFRWMLRENVEGDSDGNTGIAARLQLGYLPEREPEIRNKAGKDVETDWIQERDNQLSLLDTFFGALRPKESLCFFYAKRTPLSEQSRRVIIGVGRVLSIGPSVEYAYSTKNPPLRCVLWERNVGHSVRPDFSDGFLFPYREALDYAQRNGSNPEEFVAFAPDECFESYSYGSEHLNHDGAVASLVSCAAALHRIRGRIEGPWEDALAWVDGQLNRLWKARGAHPGIGSALAAFGFEWGFQHGTLLAHELELLRERNPKRSMWEYVNEVMEGTAKVGGPIAALVTTGMRNGWKRLRPERKALLELLSRCAISENQALRIYDMTTRKTAGIEVTDDELIANPYLLFEIDRRSADPIPFGSVDRGLFPDESIRNDFPVPKPSRVDDPADHRRVRSLVVDILEEAAGEGHTLLPKEWVITRARDRSLHPPCPLGENVLDASEHFFAPIVSTVSAKGAQLAYQVDRLCECRSVIKREITGRIKGKRTTGDVDWRAQVDGGLPNGLPDDEVERELENRAREEKAAALEQLYSSRISVLIGPAGTGKTTLLRMLCALEEIKRGGILLLAPTGKARVRLEEQTELRGAGLTLAQFLIRYQRYDAETGAYRLNKAASRCRDYRTVVVDECSMLTEEQLSALIDSLVNVDRVILVGDPRQLPPIGAGRPFVDIVNLLTPKNVDTLFPRCGPGYAELTIPRRQLGDRRLDVLLASHFNGRPLEPGADGVWDEPESFDSDRLRLIRWDQQEELQTKLLQALVQALDLSGLDDELKFEMSLGGSPYGDSTIAFFWNKFRDNPGAASKAEEWQILSPIRAGSSGVEALNRLIQATFRTRARQMATAEGWGRKVPRPIGRQSLLYGDKVINVINQRRRDVYPKNENGDSYLANGDIGIIVGQYKTKTFKGLPWKAEVEFAGQLGQKFGFYAGEFGDEGKNPLELAYCLTVHKTQGSEFGTTFVVLTNPCWLLSRELLYTALTRHKNRLVILHQGPLSDYRRFSGDEHSEIARRMTNLFVDPYPRTAVVGNQQRFLEDGLIHRTERGDLVRSKSELIIADKLFARGIEYAYEQPLVLPSGRIRYPDFTIADSARGVTYYWEHLGLLDDPGYRVRWNKKREEYLSAGILPWKDGGGDAGSLIETRDDEGGALDAASLAQLIDEVFC